MDDVGAALLAEARRRLVGHYPAQVRAALEALDDEQIWRRPNRTANSVGNLVLHICGQARFFLGRGIGGGGYVRDRPSEFSEQGHWAVHTGQIVYAAKALKEGAFDELWMKTGR